MHRLIRLFWDAAVTMWKACNQMEHGTTATARTKYATERMNAQLTTVYSQKKSVSIAWRIQLFQIPLEKRKKYRIHTNERWLEMISSAVANKHRNNEKSKRCQRTIKNFLPVRKDGNISTNSSTTEPHIHRKYVQGNLKHLYTDLVHTPRNNISPQIQNVIHRKAKYTRITAFFKLKDI